MPAPCVRSAAMGCPLRCPWNRTRLELRHLQACLALHSCQLPSQWVFHSYPPTVTSMVGWCVAAPRMLAACPQVLCTAKRQSVSTQQFEQVLDRIALHGGNKLNWHSTALRLRLANLLVKSQRPQQPQGLLGLSFRARAAAGKATSHGVPARKPPLTVNVASDVHRLDNLGFLSRTNFTAAHIPSTTIALRQSLHAGNTMRMAAHVNRPFASSSGWQKVRACAHGMSGCTLAIHA
jgi:hypothetical protein